MLGAFVLYKHFRNRNRVGAKWNFNFARCVSVFVSGFVRSICNTKDSQPLKIFGSGPRILRGRRMDLHHLRCCTLWPAESRQLLVSKALGIYARGFCFYTLQKAEIRTRNRTRTVEGSSPALIFVLILLLFLILFCSTMAIAYGLLNIFVNV